MELIRFPVSQHVLSFISRIRGSGIQAVEAMRQASKADPEWHWILGAMCAAAGRTAEARGILAELEAQPVDPWGALWRAVINAALARRKQRSSGEPRAPSPVDRRDGSQGMGDLHEAGRGDRVRGAAGKVDVPK